MNWLRRIAAAILWVAAFWSFWQFELTPNGDIAIAGWLACCAAEGWLGWLIVKPLVKETP